MRIVVVDNYVPPHVGGLDVLVDREVRTLQRRFDELLGTSFYRPNRIARALPEPEQPLRTGLPGAK